MSVADTAAEVVSGGKVEGELEGGKRHKRYHKRKVLRVKYIPLYIGLRRYYRYLVNRMQYQRYCRVPNI